MGKKGIPMTVVMQNPAYMGNEPAEIATPKNQVVGSLYYGEDGKPTMTASAFNIMQSGGQI